MHKIVRCGCAFQTPTQSYLKSVATSHHVHQRRYIESSSAASPGFFQSISESSAVLQTQNLLENIHDLSGLPWWATICVSTVLFRSAVTLPLTIYQNKIFARLENIREELNSLVPELKKETAIAIKKFGWTEKEAKEAFSRSMKKQYDLRVIRENCHPIKSTVVIWAQLPMWVCLSMAFRNMASVQSGDIQAQLTFLEFTLGGTLWFPNLTLPDASWILPVTLGLVNLAIVEIQVANRAAKAAGAPNKLQRYATNFFRVVSVIMVPVAASVPSCMSLYWTASSTCGLAHNMLLFSPKFRRLVRIPKSANELKNPYSNLVKHFQEKLRL
ncbi:cytochrome c oxidase assembly protein COX18, mitochondrial [Neocloeon triangulifer]|uniref:cytochrome c oxidase assembly protein COX18, mitochondrial n=1 Tax=Neocloeon triangulifer TaxID=2078957 RepID=UPI00286F3FBE|nr:cytochrome c oxidase assembly protein COX18, mitochondrial [Neocloeon triangulifer]